MLYVQCKGCGRPFETVLPVPPAELLIDRTFNSMEACLHCKAMSFYVRDDFHVKEAEPDGSA